MFKCFQGIKWRLTHPVPYNIKPSRGRGGFRNPCNRKLEKNLWIPQHRRSWTLNRNVSIQNSQTTEDGFSVTRPLKRPETPVVGSHFTKEERTNFLIFLLYSHVHPFEDSKWKGKKKIMCAPIKFNIISLFNISSKDIWSLWALVWQGEKSLSGGKTKEIFFFLGGGLSHVAHSGLKITLFLSLSMILLQHIPSKYCDYGPVPPDSKIEEFD